MDNPLIKLIEIIKTGAVAEVKSAQKEVEKFWYNIYIPKREEGRKAFFVFLDEIKIFDEIRDTNHQAYFINTLKWPLWSIGEENFEEWSQFIIKYIQHPSGKIRQAVIHATDYLIMDIIVDLRFDSSKKTSQAGKERVKKNRDRFGDFAYRIEGLLEKYDEPRFRRYQYISSMPASIYKSLQKLLVEVLLRSEYYESLYRDWLKEKYQQDDDFRKKYFDQVNVFNDYLACHNQIDWQEVEDKKSQFIAEREKIFDKEYSLADKKRLIFILAHIGTIECYESLKEYLKEPDDELKQWTEIALDECETFLKSYILEEDSISAMAGAGKKEDRLRFYFVINHYEKKNFSEEQKQTITWVISNEAVLINFVVEDIEINENYVLITALHRFDQAPAELIEPCIMICNKNGYFISNRYFVINTHKPTAQEIKDCL